METSRNKKRSLKRIIRKLWRDPEIYFSLDEEDRTDPQICLEALENTHTINDDLFQRIFQAVLPHVPTLKDHKRIFFLCLRTRESRRIQLYMDQFGSELYPDTDFLIEAMGCDEDASLVTHAPLELREDLSFIKFAVEHSVPVGAVLQKIPLTLLSEHPELLMVAVTKEEFDFDEQNVPNFLWRNRDFVVHWLTRCDLDLACLPEELSHDRPVCRALFERIGRGVPLEREQAYISWMSNAWLDDSRDFVLECVAITPKMYLYCNHSFRTDFDFRVAMAFHHTDRSQSLFAYLYEMDESIVPFARQLQSKINARQELLTWLACCQRSCLMPFHPLRMLDVGNDTSRGFKSTIASYLGFPTQKALSSIKHVWDEMINYVVENDDDVTDYLLPVIRPEALVPHVLTAIRSYCHVGLQEFPVQLWSHRRFVKWAAQKGLFNNAIPQTFWRNKEICLSYYLYSSRMTRKEIMPRIAKYGNLNRNFVLKCASVDPLILSYCKEDAIRYDFEVLRQAANISGVNTTLRPGLVQDAIDGGWADSLVFFAKTVRTKIESSYSFHWFGVFLERTYFSGADRRSSLLRTKKWMSQYLGIPKKEEHKDLEVIWSDRSIFYLALGGDINNLSKVENIHLEYERACGLPPTR